MPLIFTITLPIFVLILAGYVGMAGLDRSSWHSYARP
jgi:hypothetical protein